MSLFSDVKAVALTDEAILVEVRALRASTEKMTQALAGLAVDVKKIADALTAPGVVGIEVVPGVPTTHQ